MAKKVTVKIEGKETVSKAARSAKKGVKDLDQGVKKSAATMLKSAAAIGGVILVVKKLHKVFNDLEAVYKVQGEAETLFEAALRATGTAAEVSADKIYDLAASLQSVTLFGDEATIVATALVQSLSSLSQEGLEKIIPLLQDFSTGMKIDLQTAASLVGKTLGSTTNALARYGIVIDATLPKEEKLIALTESLESKFGGMSEALGATAIATKEQLGFAISDLKEQMGRAIAVGMKPFREWLTNIVVEAVKAEDAINDVIELLDRGDKFEMVDRMEEIRTAIDILEKRLKGKIRVPFDPQVKLLKELKNELINLGMQYDLIAMQQSEAAIAARKAAELIKEEEELQIKLIKGMVDYNAALEKTLTTEEKKRREYETIITGLQDYINILPRITSEEEAHFQAVAALRDVYRELLKALKDIKDEGPLFPALPQAGTPPIAGAAGAGGMGILGTDPGRAMEIITEELEKQIDLAIILESGIQSIAEAFGAVIIGAENAADIMKEAFKSAIATAIRALAQFAFAESLVAFAAQRYLKGAALLAASIAAYTTAGVVQAMQYGGVINEPILGIGASGQRYLFGESGPERVIPMGKGGGGNVYITVEGSILAERDLEGIALQGLKKLNRGY